MVMVNDAKPLTLDRQYIVPGNVMIIRMQFFDLVRHQFAFMCQVKSYTPIVNQADEFNHLCLIDHSWGECGELEFIDLNGTQTLVRFYLPGPFELSEIEERENAFRQSLSRSRIGLWIYENMGWTPKVIAIFADELYEHRVTCLRDIQELVVKKLGLSPYPLSYFQIQPAPQIGISHLQADSSQLQTGITKTNRGMISHIKRGMISERQADTPWVQSEEGRDTPQEYPADKSDITLTGDDQEMLRLWSAGLTAKEIGVRTGKTGKTIMNRLSVLRGMYGEERIPLRKKPTRKDLG
jgi:hypothetical protein